MDTYFSPGDFSKMNPDALIERQQALEKEAKIKLEAYVFKKLAKNLPSFNSKDYGKPFKQIFLDYEKDFYKIDGSLFSPATVLLNSKKSGQSYSSGEVSFELVEQSFKS